MYYKNHFNVQRVSIKMPATTFNCKLRPKWTKILYCEEKESMHFLNAYTRGVL